MQDSKQEDNTSAETAVAEIDVGIPARDGASEPPSVSQTLAPNSSDGQHHKPGEKWKADEVHTLPAK